MTDLTIQGVAPATRDRWLSVALTCEYATYFHTPYWYELIAPKQKHVALEVTFSDGASAVIPIAKIKRAGGLLTDNFSSPGGTYGGWISASALNEGHVCALLGVLASKENLTFRANPFDRALTPSLLASAIPPTPTTTLIDDFTHTLDLTKGIDSLLGGMDAGHRRGIKAAMRNGVTVKRAETLAEWERYYGLYRESVARWRANRLTPRTVYPARFFKRLYERRSGHEVLWLAQKDGTPVAGALFFYWGGRGIYWHGAASARYFHIRPNHLLFWEIIADAARSGHTVFDFNPSGGYGGVESFKKRFGATATPTPVLQTKTKTRQMIAQLRRCLQKNTKKR